MKDQFDTISRHHKPFCQFLAYTFVMLIGWIRFQVGPELAFSLFFLLPIITVTWLVGMRAGILTSIISALSWLLADLFMIERFSSLYIPLINELLRLSIFLFIVFMIARYKKILEHQKELALLDPLTGVANRRAFFQLAQTESDRSRRYNHPFSIMVIDIDNFKHINDYLGHDIGDRLLVAVVETIRHHVRAIDIVARFGGDEFVVLLVRTEADAALMVARKLQAKLLDLMASNQWGVTFSIGLATYHSAPESIQESIRVADGLMYDVKHSGKDAIKHTVIDTKTGSDETN